ncbi:Hypothetical_protein [Hexamita inflata]|uniref:Hypothetical_protein n=1 Tax=Hexamita inflata TaxID=28002 RepID=A0AA86TJ86_9EUKA|nr:Hypothetical protein HINF_LOCUS6780 [Hexamita inflata]
MIYNKQLVKQQFLLINKSWINSRFCGKCLLFFSFFQDIKPGNWISYSYQYYIKQNTIPAANIAVNMTNISANKQLLFAFLSYISEPLNVIKNPKKPTIVMSVPAPIYRYMSRSSKCIVIHG